MHATLREPNGRNSVSTELEVRSYEVEYVGGLWHADFRSGSLADAHEASGRILEIPQLFGGLDDRSRLRCHGQWYLAETAENFAH